MARHVSYRGVTIDMDSLRRENEKVPAIGNMSVNSKGDRIKGATIVKTSDQIARENHKLKSMVVNTGLKGPLPESNVNQQDQKKISQPIKSAAKKVKETELPSGDIIIGDDE
jgi:hypothetical protein